MAGKMCRWTEPPNNETEHITVANAIDNLQGALLRATANRPKVGGFPYFSETLRQAGVTRNSWYLPSCQSLFITESGSVTVVGKPLVTGMVAVPPFNREALIAALRTDQAGEGSFEEFLEASWDAGVVRYEVDFSARVVRYFGCSDEMYEEAYSRVEV